MQHTKRHWYVCLVSQRPKNGESSPTQVWILWAHLVFLWANHRSSTTSLGPSFKSDFLGYMVWKKKIVLLNHMFFLPFQLLVKLFIYYLFVFLLLKNHINNSLVTLFRTLSATLIFWAHPLFNFTSLYFSVFVVSMVDL